MISTVAQGFIFNWFPKPNHLCDYNYCFILDPIPLALLMSQMPMSENVGSSLMSLFSAPLTPAPSACFHLSLITSLHVHPLWPQ